MKFFVRHNQAQILWRKFRQYNEGFLQGARFRDWGLDMSLTEGNKAIISYVDAKYKQ